MKRLSNFIILLLVLNLITACTDNNDFFLKEDEDSVQELLQKDTEVTTLTLFSEDLITNDFSSPVAKAITEKTGVVIDVEVPVGNVNDKIGLMMASGDYPDLVLIKHIAQFVDAGAYIDLTPLIEEHAPNLKKLYGDNMNRLKYSADDQAIYVLPSAPVDNQKWTPNGGFELQHDVVMSLGYPEMKTVYDYENALKAYIAENPEINGLPTIGISLLADDWRWFISLSNPGAFVTGLPDDGQWHVDPVTYETKYRFSTDHEKKYYRWLNHMYDIGLIDPDSFVQKYESYIAKIASGRVLGLIDAKWQYNTAEQMLLSYGMNERAYGQYPLQMDDSTIAADFRDHGYTSGYGIGISINCEDPVKAIKFLDYMASDEGHILRHWGIENLNYYVDLSGERIIYPDQLNRKRTDGSYPEETGVGNFVYPYPTWGTGVKDETDNYISSDTNDLYLTGYTVEEKAVLQAYNAERWSDLYPSSDELSVSKWGEAWDMPIPGESGITVLLKRCDEIAKEGLIKAIISDPSDFDYYWEEMQGNLENAEVEVLNQKFTELIKARVKAWE